MRQRNKTPKQPEELKTENTDENTPEKRSPNKKNVGEVKTRNGDEESVKLKFGPLGLKHEHKAWSRAILFTGVLIVAVVFKWRKSSEITWVSHKHVNIKGHQVACSQSFLEEIGNYEGCPLKKCGRFVMDGVVSLEEVGILSQIFKKGLEFGHSSGGASILDLHSGALSKEDHFINIYQLPKSSQLWTDHEFTTYVQVKNKIKEAIAKNFDLKADALYLTSPTFFSEMTDRPPKTVHDEYWHPHVDKETYETFHFTSLLYLSDYGSEFQGGRFVFIDKDNFNRTVEPRKGRISMFTSGGENLHFVEKISSGTRYALTIAFTCDSAKSIADPQIR